MDETHAVANTVALTAPLRLFIVSGSNMSGKSTLLRTIGVNTVLALAGAPVRAARLTLTPPRSWRFHPQHRFARRRTLALHGGDSASAPDHATAVARRCSCLTSFWAEPTRMTALWGPSDWFARCSQKVILVL